MRGSQGVLTSRGDASKQVQLAPKLAQRRRFGSPRGRRAPATDWCRRVEAGCGTMRNCSGRRWLAPNGHGGVDSNTKRMRAAAAVRGDGENDS